MSLTPSDILSKLEHLTKWQEKQQRLLEKHNKRLDENNFTPTERDYLQAKLGVDLTPEPLANHQKTSPPKSLSKPTVEVDKPQMSQTNSAKPRQKFLRRGAGLTRFNMTPGEQFKPFTGKTAKEVRKASTIGVKNRITPLKRPEVSVQPKAAWFTATTSAQEEASLVDLSRPQKGSHQVNASDRDLLIFETLEQRAMQNSFCSTNSSIVRLLSSTPHKNTPIKPGKMDKNQLFQEECRVQQVCGNGAQFEAVYARQHTAEDDVMQVRFAKHNHLLGDPQETLLKANKVDEYERKIQNEYLNLIEQTIKYKQFIAGGGDKMSSCSSTSSIVTDDLGESTLQTETNFQDDKKWSDFAASVSEGSEGDEGGLDVRCDAQTMTDGAAEDLPILVEERGASREKLMELEKEMKGIRMENAAVNRLRGQLEQQRREFEKYKKDIVKQMEDEKVKINFALEEERKKMAKEKMVFERYVRDSRTRPSKKEREEMATLKTEIAALKETLKLKESRNGTAQARLRNQIKSLERENAGLKGEIEKLNRENGKLVASQKVARRPSETKMLHEINRNLTKLAREQLKGRAGPASDGEEGGDKEVGVEPAVRGDFGSSRATPERSRSSHRRRRTLEADEKKNDKNGYNNSPGGGVNLIEDTYEQAFASHYALSRQLSTQEETKKNDRTEKTLADGTKQIHYTNGNVKTVSPDGNHIVFKFFNGDVKETDLLRGTVCYHYHETKISHTTNADSSELIEFPDGQKERRSKGGTCEVQYPNGTVRRTRVDGTEEVCYPDGTTVQVNMQGERVLLLPNGQKEVHTKEHKRREYPDGTVKILYPDGLQETRYANGRVRLRDKHGKLLMDSQNPETA